MSKVSSASLNLVGRTSGTVTVKRVNFLLGECLHKKNSRLSSEAFLVVSLEPVGRTSGTVTVTDVLVPMGRTSGTVTVTVESPFVNWRLMGLYSVFYFLFFGFSELS